MEKRRIFLIAYFLFFVINSLGWSAKIQRGDFILVVEAEGASVGGDSPANIALNHKYLGRIIELGEFYIANKEWKTIFPTKEVQWEMNQKGDTIIYKTKESIFKAEITYSVCEEGLKMEIFVEVPPGTDANFVVWDIFLSKPLFTNAQVVLEGQEPILLNPSAWNPIKIDTLLLKTEFGDWNFKLESEIARWHLRSVNDPWRKERLRTFTLLSNAILSQGGLKEKRSFELKFIPVQGYKQKIEKMSIGKVLEYMKKVISNYGFVLEEKDLPKDENEQAKFLAKKICSVSSKLKENRIDPFSGVVIPQPKQYKKGLGVFVVPHVLEVMCSPIHEGILELLSNEFSNYNVKINRVDPQEKFCPVIIGVPSQEPAIDRLLKKLGINLTIPDSEGYILIVSSKQVIIAGSDDKGALYGCQTLRQLIRNNKGTVEIPEVEIKDWPDMKFRGFYVEGGGRHLKDIEEMKRLIRDVYSYFKGNAIVFEMSGWNEFKWKSHPEMSAPDALPIEDLISIAEYAKKFKLNFIPGVFTYGKVGPLLRIHPEIAEDPDWQKSKNNSYCPNKPETYKLIFDMMQEIIDAAKPNMMHIGHDEICGIGRCSVCKKIPPGDLFAQDVNKIANWLKERNVETIIWGDLLLDYKRWTPLGVSSAHSNHPYYGNIPVHEAIDKIQKDVIIADWHYDTAKTQPTLKFFKDSGFRVIGCPWHKDYNNYYLALESYKAGIMGVLVTDWGFLGTRSPGATSILGVVYAWNISMPEPEELKWSPLAVLSSSIHRKNLPSKCIGAKFIPINLDSIGNKKLIGDEDAWFEMGYLYDLSYLPQGKHNLFGIDYYIGEKAVVVGKQDKEKKIPPKIENIPVNVNAKSLIFLQAMHVDNPTVFLGNYGKYSVKFESGKIVDITINSKNITHWLSNTPRKTPWMPWRYGYTWESILAWEGCTKLGEPVNLQAYEWVNPNPDDKIISVDVIAQQDVPGLILGLVALTAVQ